MICIVVVETNLSVKALLFNILYIYTAHSWQVTKPSQNALLYPIQQWLRECVTILRYTYTACLVPVAIRVFFYSIWCVENTQNLNYKYKSTFDFFILCVSHHVDVISCTTQKLFNRSALSLVQGRTDGHTRWS